MITLCFAIFSFVSLPGPKFFSLKLFSRFAKRFHPKNFKRAQDSINYVNQSKTILSNLSGIEKEWDRWFLYLLKFFWFFCWKNFLGFFFIENIEKIFCKEILIENEKSQWIRNKTGWSSKIWRIWINLESSIS